MSLFLTACTPVRLVFDVLVKSLKMFIIRERKGKFSKHTVRLHAVELIGSRLESLDERHRTERIAVRSFENHQGTENNNDKMTETVLDDKSTCVRGIHKRR